MVIIMLMILTASMIKNDNPTYLILFMVISIIVFKMTITKIIGEGIITIIKK